MKIVDVNIVVYAVHRGAAQHETVRDWWEAALNSDEPVGLSWAALLGVLRLATHPAVFTQPLTVDQALGRLAAWLSHPNTRLLQETAEHWRVLQELISQTGTAGNRTSDAHLAALAICHGATLASCDSDFRRFRQLRWENPLAPK